MTEGSQGNAMTEIALAMAMGFFSIMVLTMMSMGVGMVQKKTIDTALLTPAASPSAVAADTVEKDDLLVIYHAGRYLDGKLQPLDRAALKRASRVILAVPPDLSMKAAMTARRGLAARNLVVTTLDRRWRKALEGRSAGRTIR